MKNVEFFSDPMVVWPLNAALGTIRFAQESFEAQMSPVVKSPENDAESMCGMFV